MSVSRALLYVISPLRNDGTKIVTFFEKSKLLRKNFQNGKENGEDDSPRHIIVYIKKLVILDVCLLQKIQGL